MPNPDEIYDVVEDGEKLIKASTLYSAFENYHQTYLEDKSYVMHYRGSVEDAASLPANNNLPGDVYNVISTGENYAWDGEDWDIFGAFVDLTDYATQEYVDDKFNTNVSVDGNIIATGEITATDENSTQHNLTEKLNTIDYRVGYTWGEAAEKFTWATIKGEYSGAQDSHTPILHLTKPGLGSQIDIDVLNNNFDILDANISPSILDLTYPIGSIYTSINSTSPSALFGGTWQRITGKFLLAATDNGNTNAEQEAGNEGGTATVTLDSTMIPSHTHSVGAHSHGLNSHKHSVGAHAHGLNSHTHAYDKSSTSTGGTAITTANLPKDYAYFYLRTGGVWSGTNATVTEVDSNYNLFGVQNDAGRRAKITFSGSGTTHNHSITLTSTASGAASGNTANSTAFDSGAASGSTANSTAFDSGAAGGGKAHNNMPPYLSVYVWKRVA